MWLSLCSKVAFSGVNQKLRKARNDERKDNRHPRGTDISSFKSSLINAHKNCHMKKKSGPLEVVAECVKSPPNDSVINLANPSVVQLLKAVQAANLTGERIIVSADDSKSQMPQSEAKVAQSQFKVNMGRFLEMEYPQIPNTDWMCRTSSADDVHKEHSRSYNLPESSVMRVRSKDRMFSIREVDIDDSGSVSDSNSDSDSDSDCESLTQSEGYLFDTMYSIAVNKMELERASSMISSVKCLTDSVEEPEGNPHQKELLCNMISLAHLAFVIASLRGLF